MNSTDAPKPEILHESTETGGRYFIPLDEGLEAEMTYRFQSKDIIVIDHTFVPAAARGHGIAERLVKRGVADARTSGLKIVPACSYAAAQFRRHADWSDLLAG